MILVTLCDVYFRLLGTNGCHENERFTAALLMMSSEHQNFEIFISSFDRLRQKIVPKSVPHVQHDHFYSFNQSNYWLVARYPCSCSRRFLNSSLTHFLLRVSNGFFKTSFKLFGKNWGKFKLKVILLSSSGTMTIGKLKGLLYRLFKVDITDQQLYCVDGKVITGNFIPFF